MMVRRFRPTLVACCASLAVLFAAVPAGAQYFGRNSVQYETFDFRVLETPHFAIHHYDEQAARIAGSLSERWYARFAPRFFDRFTDAQPLVLYSSQTHFMQTTAVSGQIGETTGGVTTPLQRRIVLPMAGPLESTDEVLGHELVHAFQFAMAGIEPSGPLVGGVGGLGGLPLWLVEGMAAWLSRGQNDAETAMRLRSALAHDKLPSFDDLLNAQEYFPYRWGQAFLAWLASNYGDDAIITLFREAAARGNLRVAFANVFNAPADSLVLRWHQDIRQTYGPLVARATPLDSMATPLITEATEGGTLNVAPVISPDGRRIVFLSERELFSIEMYLADAETGEVLRKLTETAVDPHFQTLGVINSTGSWAPDSRRFALPAISEGQPVLALIDTESGERLREFRFPQFGDILSASWSPDGERIAFIANVEGFLDLFVLDIETGEHTRLTDDVWAELHPAWSPDSRRIAFATDRFGADAARLTPGPFQLAIIDAGGGNLQRLPSFEDARNTNPVWSADGSSLYFLSDRGGVANIYRHDVQAGGFYQITDVITGVTGITSLSPALAFAPEAARMVFSAFDDEEYNIYRIEGEEALRGRSVPDAPVAAVAAMLPPERDGSIITQLLETDEPPPPDAASFAVRDYSGSLKLDFIAPPALAIGGGSFGTFIGGGIAFHFSDLLGRHSLTTVVQADIRDGEVLNGLGALADYWNRRGRWDLGFQAGQIPQITQSVRAANADVNGDGVPEEIWQVTRFWQVTRTARGMLQYPFNRFQRLEFSAGAEQYAFELRTEEQVFDITGDQIAERSFTPAPCGDSLSFIQTFCNPSSLWLASGTAALVYDNALVGAIAPLQGTRYRLELTPSLGSLNFVTGLADVRRYVMPVRPLTLAGRVLHYGRYGRDSNDDRLGRLFVGFPDFVRGYDIGSFSLGRCPRDQPLETCSEVEVFESLIGTRLAVFNAEARLPLLGPLGVLGGRSFPLPFMLVGFFDAGVAWTGDDEASFLGGDRDIVRSTGIGLRMNLLGFTILEIDYVDPLDRPLRGAHFTFGFFEAF